MNGLQRRRAATRGYSADHAGLEVEEHRAGHVLAAQGLVVKYTDAAEVRIVAAAIIAAAADAVLIAHHLHKLGAHLITARPVEKITWRQEERGIKKRGRGGGGGNAAAADKPLGICAAGKMNYTALCVQWKVNHRGEVPSASWNRWP